MTNNTVSPLSVQLAHTLRGHTSDVNTVIFSPTHSTSPLLASCSSDKTIRLWDVKTGNIIRIFNGHTDWVQYHFIIIDVILRCHVVYFHQMMIIYYLHPLIQQLHYGILKVDHLFIHLKDTLVMYVIVI